MPYKEVEISIEKSKRPVKELDPSNLLGSIDDKSQRPAAIKILVVDDVHDYTQELAVALRNQGYEVTTAENGKEAIVLGASFHPDILVTDWLLSDHIHGIDVAEALSIACPNITTIIMTGFATADLEADARAIGVSGFLEKPFPIEFLFKAINSAKPPKLHDDHGIAFIEIDEEGREIYANPLGKEFMQIICDPEIDCISAKFEELLERASSDWIPYYTEDNQSYWLIRTKELYSLGNKSIFVALKEGLPSTVRENYACRLLGLPDPAVEDLTLGGHVLIVDDMEFIRRLSVTVLKKMHCVCLTAQNNAEAIRLFVHDPDIKYVLLDYNLGTETSEETIAVFRKLRPGVHIIGMSADHVSTVFSDRGVHHYLQKPWGIEQLLSVLRKLRDESEPASDSN